MILQEFFQDVTKPENVGVYNLSKGINRFCLSKPGTVTWRGSFFCGFLLFQDVSLPATVITNLIVFGISAGVYKVTPRSCHQFEQDYYTYDTYVFYTLHTTPVSDCEVLSVTIAVLRNTQW